MPLGRGGPLRLCRVWGACRAPRPPSRRRRSRRRRFRRRSGRSSRNTVGLVVVGLLVRFLLLVLLIFALVVSNLLHSSQNLCLDLFGKPQCPLGLSLGLLNLSALALHLRPACFNGFLDAQVGLLHRGPPRGPLALPCIAKSGRLLFLGLPERSLLLGLLFFLHCLLFLPCRVKCYKILQLILPGHWPGLRRSRRRVGLKCLHLAV
mmetsp:Transcript_30437/g.101144  ORF Transcript_30437/g.101144 Transcript_30437/m.101144 type:complete len:206 (+) Transcript_30437:212-829(+)